MNSPVKSYTGVHEGMSIKVVNIHDKNEYVDMNDKSYDWIVRIDRN
jgi:hypothetical protein